MVKEEHTQQCSNSSGGGGGGGGGCAGGISSGGRSSKRLKQKKVPQRGLGVAQLEKIRLEEQQKKEAVVNNVMTPNPFISPSNSSSCLGGECHIFRPVVSPSPIPFLPRPPPPPPPPIPPPVAEIEVLHPDQVPKLWNGAYHVKGERRRIEHQGFGFRPNEPQHPYESRPRDLPLPTSMQRSQHFRPHPSSMVWNSRIFGFILEMIESP